MADDQSFIVAQIGARMHYAVPRILHSAGRLEQLFTDLSVNHGAGRIAGMLPPGAGPRFLQRIRDRKAAGVPDERVTAFTSVGVQFALKLRAAKTDEEVLSAFLWCEAAFSKQLVRQDFGAATSIYAFNHGALGLFEHQKSAGLVKILEQTSAPKRVENAIRLEADPTGTAPGYFDSPLMQVYVEREEAEWALADAIICGSEFVKDGLISCGVSAQKCHVVPYGVNLSQYRNIKPKTETAPDDGTVNILFVGAVAGRKGIWTLLEAMKRLKHLPIKCRVVGMVAADRMALAEACPDNTEIVGPVPRSAIPDEFARADIFCLPSLSEGSATVVYEALAAGVPVVTTHNAGSIVRDGTEGLIVPHSDDAALADALDRLAGDAALRADMRQAALARSGEGSIEAYAARLITTMDSLARQAAADGR